MPSPFGFTWSKRGIPPVFLSLLSFLPALEYFGRQYHRYFSRLPRRQHHHKGSDPSHYYAAINKAHNNELLLKLHLSNYETLSYLDSSSAFGGAALSANCSSVVCNSIHHTTKYESHDDEWGIGLIAANYYLPAHHLAIRTNHPAF